MPEVPGSPYEPYPTVEPQVEFLRPGGLPDVPAAFGTATARAISTFGGDVQQAGKEVFDRALALRQMQIEGGVRDNVTDAMNTVEQMKVDFRKKQGYAASEGMNDALAQAEQVRIAKRTAVVAQYGDYGGKLFDNQYSSMQRSIVRDIGGHAQTQFNDAQKTSLANANAAGGNAIGSSPWDERVWQTQVAARQQREETNGSLSQLPRDEIDFNKKTAVSELARIRVMQAALADTQGTGAAYDLFQRLKNDSSLSDPKDIDAAEKVVRQRFDAGSKAAIDSKEQDLLDEHTAYGSATPKAMRLQSEIDTLRQRRVTLGEPQEVSDLAGKELQGRIGAADTAYKVNAELRGTSQFQPMIDTASARHGLNPIMLARQLDAESGLNPNVKDSTAGAQGIAQFMPDTARRFGVNVRSAPSSIEGAATYMDWLMQQPYIHGNVGLALAGYNWGEGRVQAWEASGFNPRMGPPKETRDYVQKITGQSMGDWIAGTRPDWNELGYPQTASGGRQRALAIAQQAAGDPNIPPSQRQLNVAAADKAIKTWDENNIRLANVTEVKQKQIDEKLMDDVLKDNQRLITEDAIKQMPGPDNNGPSFAAKERAIKLVNMTDMPEVPKRVSDSNTVDFYNRIILPEGNPNKITDPNVIHDGYNNHLFTRESHDWLVNKLRDPDGDFAKLRRDFSAAVLPAIDKSSIGLPDAEGKLRAYAFERMVDKQIAEWRSAGKNPMELLQPGSNYLGRPEILHQPQWQPSMQDEQAAYLERLQRGMPGAAPTPAEGPSAAARRAAGLIPSTVRPAAAAAAPPLPFRKPGESMNDYDKRAGIR